MRGLVKGLVVVAALLVAVDVALPALAARGAQAALAQQFGAGSELSVHLQSNPGLRMLAGQFDRIQVSGRDLKTDGLVVDRFDSRFQEVRLNLLGMLTGQGLQVQRVGQMQVQLTISEAHLNQFLWAEVARQSRVVSKGAVTLGQGTVTITARVAGNGAGVDVRALGRLAVAGSNHNQIAFVTDQLWLNGRQVPQNLQQVFLRTLGLQTLAFDLSQMPVPVTVTALRVTPGFLTIEAVAARGSA